MKICKLRYILFIILAVIYISITNVSARNYITGDKNGFKDKDSLIRITIPYLPSESKGLNANWTIPEYSNYSNTIARISFTTDTILVDTPDALYYYKQYNDSLYLNGFQNRTINLEYISPIFIGPTTMCYGDSISHYFGGSGTIYDKHNIFVYGISYSKADSYGNLIFGIDTIPNVLRIHRHTESIRDSYSKLQSQITYNMWADSIKSIYDNIESKIVEDRWRWYCKGCRYPIMESILIKSSDNINDTETLKKTYLFLPLEQWSTLPYDQDNQRDRYQVLNRVQNNADFTLDHEYDDMPISINAELSSDKQAIYVTYDQFYNGQVKFIASDILGHLLASSNISNPPGHYNIQLPLNKRPMGNIVILKIESLESTLSIKVSED